MKDSEKEHEEKELYFRSALESAAYGVMLLDEEARFTLVNSTFLRWVGREAKDFVGKTVREVSPPFLSRETTQIIAERAAKRVKTGEPIHGVEVELIDKDGKPIPVAYSATGIRSQKGKVLGEIVLLSSELSIVRAERAVLERDEVIRKLSTPIVEVAEGVVLLPVVGILDSTRAKQLTESVMECIARTKVNVIVMDVSGIAAIDTKSASNILRTVQAVRLMGSEAIITGIRPDVAVTLVTLGVDLSGIETRGTLREGLKYAYDELGFKLTKTQ